MFSSSCCLCLELFPPKANLLEAIDVGALMGSKIRHIELLEQVSKFVINLNYRLNLLILRAFIIEEHKPRRASLTHGQTLDIHGRLVKLRTLSIVVDTGELVCAINEET